MTEDLSHGEIQELLGAYALGAVDERERALIEAHLETCQPCQVELDDHSLLVEALRRHASRVSPLASTEANGSARTSKEVSPVPLVRRWAVPVALTIVFALLGGLFAQGEIRFKNLDATMDRIELLERAQLATADPASVLTTLRAPTNEPVLTVVSRAAGGDSYVLNGALPRLAGGQTYQLWRTDGRGITAAVALGRDLEATVFSLPSAVTGFILTVERVPAPSRPTLPAVATGQIAPLT